MKKIVKVWMLAVLLGGTAADLCAQTVWHDPAAERPQSAQRMQTATDGSQTATERYIRFITNAPSVEIRYQMAGTGGVRPCRAAAGAGGMDLYTTDCNGQQQRCEGVCQSGDTLRWISRELTYHNTHQEGNEFTLFLPPGNNVRWMQIGVPEGALQFSAPFCRKAGCHLQSVRNAGRLRFAAGNGMDKYPAAPA